MTNRQACNTNEESKNNFLFIINPQTYFFMKKIRKKLSELQAELPVELSKFFSLIKFPANQECFEFAYFKTLVGILETFAEKDAEIVVLREKDTTNYKEIMRQQLRFSNPQNDEDIFEVTLQIFSNGVRDHRFAKISYDSEVFFVDRNDGGLLTVPILA